MYPISIYSNLTFKFCFKFFHSSDQRNDLDSAPNSRLLPLARKPKKLRWFCGLNAHPNVALFFSLRFGLHSEPQPAVAICSRMSHAYCLDIFSFTLIDVGWSQYYILFIFKAHYLLSFCSMFSLRLFLF